MFTPASVENSMLMGDILLLILTDVSKYQGKVWRDQPADATPGLVVENQGILPKDINSGLGMIICPDTS